MSHLKIAGTRNRFLTTWKFMRDPYRSYRNWKEKFGSTFMVKALNGDVIATCNPENIRRTFAATSDSVGQFAIETIKPLMSGGSIFIIEGEPHRRERALLSPSFHGTRIAGKAEEIRDVALRTASQWQTGTPIRIMDDALDVSLEVIIRVVFGVQSQVRVEEFKLKIKQFVSSFHPVLAFSRLLHRPLFGLSPWGKFVKARDSLCQMLDEEIETQLANPVDDQNMLSRLIHSKYEDGRAVDKAGIRAQLVSMLLAGHETTQIAIAWAMSWLHRHPEIAGRLRDELNADDSIEAIMQSELLDGICNESLRLNSIVSDIVRTLRKPMEWEDLLLPAGTNIAVAICLVHEDPELFPDPFLFNPDRWLERTFKPFEFIPFGGGVRRCIGATLAMLEMKIVVATWIKDFLFELPADHPGVEPVYRRNITMAPKSGIPLIFRGPRIGKRPAVLVS